ncbi:MAG: DegQ family serine endoprotease [Acidobacteria bacterium]|nr:DegQ family serine endoprotease [Acidobacteriota bacterium]
MFDRNSFGSSLRALTGGAARRLALAAAVSLALIGCSHVAGTAQQFAPGGATAPAATASAPASVAPVTSYADVVARVAPAVVTVRSELRTRAPQQMPFADDPFFRQFFGDRAPREDQTPRREEGVGSGVIVSADGLVLTNYHVIDGAQQIKVELTDKRVLEARVIGADKPSDLAVLKIDATGLPVLPLGDSDRVRVGDVVLAIGNPLDIGQTVTSGIVSAKGRTTGLGDGSFADFIQTDAPINRGNSGGALVNTNGELVGINSQIVGSETGGSIGIGFAIPSNMAKGVMDQLLKSGTVRRGQLGVIVQPVTSDIAQSLDLKEVRGVIVSSVQPGSAADSAGLKQGDVITALNGTAVNDNNDLRNRIASTQPGTDVALTVLRDGREQQLRARLGEYKPQTAANDRADAEGGDTNGGASRGKLGVAVEPVTPDVARQLQLKPGEQGVVVAQVDPAGPAADAGLSQGDVIEQANRQPVRTQSDLASAVQRAGTRPVLLLVNHRGTTVFVTVRPRA